MRRTRFVDWSSNNLEREEKKRREQRRTLKHGIEHVASLRFADHFATSLPYARKCSVVSMALKKRGENENNEEEKIKKHTGCILVNNNELVNGET